MWFYIYVRLWLTPVCLPNQTAAPTGARTVSIFCLPTHPYLQHHRLPGTQHRCIVWIYDATLSYRKNDKTHGKATRSNKKSNIRNPRSPTWQVGTRGWGGGAQPSLCPRKPRTSVLPEPGAAPSRAASWYLRTDLHTSVLCWSAVANRGATETQGDPFQKLRLIENVPKQRLATAGKADD